MKTRIEELTDSLIEIEKMNSMNSVLNKKSLNLEYVRNKL